MNKLFSFFSRKKSKPEIQKVEVNFNYTESIVCAQNFYGPTKKEKQEMIEKNTDK